MTDHTSPSSGRFRPPSGALASFARKCASHPRRVLGIWFVATVALIALTVVAHGTHTELIRTVPGYRALIEAFEHDRQGHHPGAALVSVETPGFGQ